MDKMSQNTNEHDVSPFNEPSVPFSVRQSSDGALNRKRRERYAVRMNSRPSRRGMPDVDNDDGATQKITTTNLVSPQNHKGCYHARQPQFNDEGSDEYRNRNDGGPSANSPTVVVRLSDEMTLSPRHLQKSSRSDLSLSSQSPQRNRSRGQENLNDSSHSHYSRRSKGRESVELPPSRSPPPPPPPPPPPHSGRPSSRLETVPNTNRNGRRILSIAPHEITLNVASPEHNGARGGTQVQARSTSTRNRVSSEELRAGNRLELAEDRQDSRQGPGILANDNGPSSTRSMHADHVAIGVSVEHCTISWQHPHRDDASHSGFVPPNRDDVSVLPSWQPPDRDDATMEESVPQASNPVEEYGVPPDTPRTYAFLIARAISTINGTGTRADDETLKTKEREEIRCLNRVIAFCLVIPVATALAVGLHIGLSRSSGEEIVSPTTAGPTIAATVSSAPSLAPSPSPSRSQWMLQNRYTGSFANELFGSVVELKGDLLAVSSPGFNSSAGLVRVTDILSGDQLGQDLVGSTAGSKFGSKMILCVDPARTRLAVLSPGNDTGVVHIYDYGSNGSWNETAVIDRTFIQKAGLNVSNMMNIIDIAMSRNGRTLAISANQIYALSDYQRNGDWIARSSGLPLQSGASVSLSGDGRLLLIAASFVPHTEVYRATLRAWEKVRYEDAGLDISGDKEFEVRDSNGGVALSEDGTRFAIGDAVGAVQAYAVNIDKYGAWGKLGLPIPIVPSPQVDSVFMDVSISDNAIAITYHSIYENGRPKVSVFVNEGQGWLERGETVQVTQETPRGSISVSLTKNGRRLAVGVPGNGLGYVEVYELNL